MGNYVTSSGDQRYEKVSTGAFSGTNLMRQRRPRINTTFSSLTQLGHSLVPVKKERDVENICPRTLGVSKGRPPSSPLR